MVFSSPLFLFLYLPIVLSCFWIAVRKENLRNSLLLLASLLFYAWGGIQFVPHLLILILVNYLFGMLINRFRQPSTAKIILATAITSNIGLLGYYKYSGFFIDNLNAIFAVLDTAPVQWNPVQVPIGLSFITFQAISYLVDTYRDDDTPVQGNLIGFSLYLAFFPKLLAGPIIRFHEVAKELVTPSISAESFAYGIQRFIIGLGKKVLIANTLAKCADNIFAIPSGSLAGPVAWLGIICYTLQIYFDFSGYSDMAIGLARMFGFRFSENFNYPYISRSITEFWRRWHISLSTWFRDYLFLPLTYALMTNKIRRKIADGKCSTPLRSHFCILIVFVLCGFWHGASWNFLIWGTVHGVLLVAERLSFGKLLKKSWPLLQHGYTLFAVMLAWVFFRTESLPAALAFLKAMFSVATVKSNSVISVADFLNNELVLTILFAMIASMPVTSAVSQCHSKYSMKLNKAFGRSVDYLFASTKLTAICFILLLSLISLASNTYNPFLYAKF